MVYKALFANQKIMVGNQPTGYQSIFSSLPNQPRNIYAEKPQPQMNILTDILPLVTKTTTPAILEKPTEKKPMEFKIGAGLTLPQKIEAEEIIKKPVTPVGFEVKLPFIQKAVVRPETLLDRYLGAIIETPERFVKSLAQMRELAKPEINYELSKIPKKKEKLYNVETYFETVDKLIQNDVNPFLAFLLVGAEASGDALLFGDLLSKSLKLASKIPVTKKEITSLTRTDLQTITRGIEKIEPIKFAAFKQASQDGIDWIKILKQEGKIDVITGKPKTFGELLNDFYKTKLEPTQAGFAKMPFVPKEKGLTKISPELQPLAQEARKYKSAEEFVNNQQKLFHGGSKELQKASVGVKILSPEQKMKLPNSMGYPFTGLSTTYYGPEYARVFAGKEGGVTELYLNPRAKVLRIDSEIDIDELSPKEFNKMAKGYDAIDTGSENEYRILTDDTVFTKSQLTDFYNQAVKGVKEVKPEIPIKLSEEQRTAMTRKITPQGQAKLELAPPGMGETNLFKQIEKVKPQTFYTGSKGIVSETKFDLSNKKVITLKGDQRTLTGTKTYPEADQKLYEKYAKDYDFVKIEHPELPAKADEYLDLSTKTWYSRDKDVAESYAKLTRWYKDEETQKAFEEFKPEILDEFQAPDEFMSTPENLQLDKEFNFTPEEEKAIMNEAFNLAQGKMKESKFFGKYETEREIGYQNFKRFLNKSKKRIELEDYDSFRKVFKKFGLEEDDFFTGAGDLSNDELFNKFKETYIAEKGGLDVLVTGIKQTPIQRATNRIKTLRPKIPIDKAQKMAEQIVSKYIPPRQETGFIYSLKKVYKRTLDAKALKDYGEPGKTIYDKIRESESWAVKNASEQTVKLNQALKGLSKEELENFGNYTEGFMETPKTVQEAVSIWREVSNDIAQKSEKYGIEIKLPNGEKIPFKPRENYYPYFLKEEILKDILRDQKRYTEFLVKMAKDNNITVAKAHKIIQDMVSNRANFYGHLERPREAELPLKFYERNPMKILGQYVIESYDRLGDAMVFGGSDDILQKLIEDIRIQGGDFEEVQKLVDRALHREHFDKTLSDISVFARTLNNLTKLSLSAITNISDISKSFIRTNFLSSVKALAQSFTKEGKQLAEKAGVLDLEIMKYAKEHGIALTKAGETFYSLTGFKWSEKFVRRMAVNSAKNYVNLLYRKLKANSNNVFARRRLEQFNLNPDELLQRGLKESDYVDAGIKAIGDMQPISRVDLPFYWQSPTGKLLVQYKTFAYKQMDFMNEFIFKEAKKGNIKPLLMALIVGTALGEGVADLKAWVRGKERPKDIPRRIIDNLLTIGGIGLPTDFLAALEYGGSLGGQFLKFVVGPTFSDLDAWATAIYNDILTVVSNKKKFAEFGEFSKKGQVQRKTLKKIIYAMPFIGPFLSSKLFPVRMNIYAAKTIPIAEEILNLLQSETETRKFGLPELPKLPSLPKLPELPKFQF